MEITDVRIRKIINNHTYDNKMRAVVSITFDDVFVVHDIKIIQGTKKLFIAMPSRKISDGTFKDTAHPIKPSFRGKIQDAIIASYEKALTENDYNFQVGSVNNGGTKKEKKE